MTETPEANRAAINATRQGAHMSAPEALEWFFREVLPLEAMLMHTCGIIGAIKATSRISYKKYMSRLRSSAQGNSGENQVISLYHRA